MYYYPQNNTGNPGYLQQASQVPMQFGLKGRPVSSLEEVRAAQIDFDGSLFIFPDIAHNRIYTKQISLDGNASLNMYELTPIPSQTVQQIDTNNFITREEFQNAITQLKENLTQSQNANSQFNF